MIDLDAWAAGTALASGAIGRPVAGGAVRGMLGMQAAKWLAPRASNASQSFALMVMGVAVYVGWRALNP